MGVLGDRRALWQRGGQGSNRLVGCGRQGGARSSFVAEKVGLNKKDDEKKPDEETGYPNGMEGRPDQDPQDPGDPGDPDPDETDVEESAA